MNTVLISFVTVILHDFIILKKKKKEKLKIQKKKNVYACQISIEQPSDHPLSLLPSIFLSKHS